MGAQLERVTTVLETLRGEYLDDLRDLVANDSGTADTDGVQQVVDWLAERQIAGGAVVTRIPGGKHADALLARWTGDGAGKVLLVGHADTVYPKGTAAARPLARDPEDHDRLIGPGAADMKGGLLLGVYALRALQVVEAPWCEVAFVVGPDEEVGSPETAPLLRRLAPDYDAALVLEPARPNGDVVTARKGGAFWRVHVAGRAAHAGVEPEKGASAFLQLARVALDVDAATRDIAGASLVIGKAAAGEAANMVPPAAEMTLDGRAADEPTMARLVAAVESAVAGAEGAVAGTTTRLTGGVSKPPMPRTTGNGALFAHARDVARELGFDLGEQATGGNSDGNTLAGAGLPVLDGLGVVGGALHTPDEYILESSIVPRAALLAGLIARLTGS